MRLLVVLFTCFGALVSQAQAQSNDCGQIDADFGEAERIGSCLAWDTFADVYASSSCFKAELGRRTALAVCGPETSSPSQLVEPIVAPKPSLDASPVLTIKSATADGSDEDKAFELYTLAIDADSCEALDFAAKSYPETTAGELARIEADLCLAQEGQFQSASDDGSDLSSSCGHYWNGSDCISDRRSLVRLVQQGLLDAGCPVGSVDGIWGKRTTAAVTALNRANESAYGRNDSEQRLSLLVGDAKAAQYGLCACPSGQYFSVSSASCKKRSASPSSAPRTAAPLCRTGFIYSLSKRRCMRKPGRIVRPIVPGTGNAGRLIISLCPDGKSFSVKLGGCR